MPPIVGQMLEGKTKKMESGPWYCIGLVFLILGFGSCSFTGWIVNSGYTENTHTENIYRDCLQKFVVAVHFEKISFRVKKKIFATLSAQLSIACVKLSLVDQSVFCSIDQSIIYPVPNKWGLQGWTNINLAKIKKNAARYFANSLH